MSIALGVLVVSGWATLVAGCGRDGGQGSDAGAPGVTMAPTVSTSPAAPSCREAITPGRPLPGGLTKSGCLDDDGMLYAVPAHRCSDGRELVSVVGIPGVPNGWAMSGDPYRESRSPANDPQYAEAYRECIQ